MDDQYGLREACNVALLKFQRDNAVLFRDPKDAELINVVFKFAYADGYGFGIHSMHDETTKVLDKHFPKGCAS